MRLNPDMKPVHVVWFIIAAALSIGLYAGPPLLLGEGLADLVRLVRATAAMATLFLLFRRIFVMELHAKILIGMVLGGIAGYAFQGQIAEIKPVGTAFIRMIQMIVVPLVLASLIVGTSSLSDLAKMKRIGTKTVVYYLCSTAFAIGVGLILANVVRPGSGMDETVRANLLDSYREATSSKLQAALGQESYVDTFLNMIPSNPFASMAEATMLQVIFFALFTGIALTMIPREKAQPVIDFFDGLNDVMIKIVTIVIKIAPYGVFALIADAVGSFGLEILLSLLKYTLVTAAGLILMVFLYPFVVRFFTGISPFKFLKDIRPAQLIAFSTSSSGATLPVTMEVVEDNVGVSKEVASFVLPLGATVNMDGTALYQGVAAVFIAQVFGMDLTFAQQLAIVLTATLASIGTAAAPGVGILMLVIVLKQINVPLEGIGLILAVDRLLDMIRTVVNITSDATAATIIAATEEGQLRPRE